MKFLLSIFLLVFSNVQAQTAKEIWEPLLQGEQIASYFSGMWDVIGINIEETGEKLTIYHKGDHFELKDGIDESEVDYNIFLVGKSIMDMGKYGEDGIIDAHESFKIMGTLFTPFVRASLQHPMMRKKFQMKLAGLETHAHVYLKDPNFEESMSHTLIFHNKNWMVISGIHGDADRIFELTPEQAIEYQKEAFMAQKANTKKSWNRFKKFYLAWRKKCSRKIEKKK